MRLVDHMRAFKSEAEAAYETWADRARAEDVFGN